MPSIDNQFFAAAIFDHCEEAISFGQGSSVCDQVSFILCRKMSKLWLKLGQMPIGFPSHGQDLSQVWSAYSNLLKWAEPAIFFLILFMQVEALIVSPCQMEEDLSTQRAYSITTISSMNSLHMVSAPFSELLKFSWCLGNWQNFPFLEPAKVISLLFLFFNQHLYSMNQESNHMLYYAITIIHRHLKMNMEGGLAERLCKVLESYQS